MESHLGPLAVLEALDGCNQMIKVKGIRDVEVVFVTVCNLEFGIVQYLSMGG